ncbi:lysoplasmalogenase [Sphingomonas sp. J344]|uniref:lysoplasmalogenase n=1 Tax=Sphingomonas sp. J344 TaxID=2898434 RepID=UPI002151BFE5|nr:lysoplasmalogenase [Sphingomonas sp. J344]MCR5872130.1 lysoplasmalogenase [Sphingomonas sp. J344]
MRGGPVWKTSGVALLAIWAATRARGTDGWLLTGALALGALGDLLLETHGLVVGGAASAAGHLVACVLYWRNRREALTPSQRAFGWLLAPATIGIAALFAAPTGGAVQAGAYSAFLGVMAALAWTSRFPRYRVGLGAVLFVASDLLIFSRFGPLEGSAIPSLLIWPTYFAAQALIAWGVSQALSTDQ